MHVLGLGADSPFNPSCKIILNSRAPYYATFPPFFELPLPLVLSLPLSVPELLLEFSAPPSVSPLGLLMSWFAGLTSRGLSEAFEP